MRDITLCHPRLQKLATELIQKCSAQGLQIKIGETLRTRSEQDTLYAQGRTTPGSIVTNAPGSSYSSYHQWGTAFDMMAVGLIMIKMAFSPGWERLAYPLD